MSEGSPTKTVVQRIPFHWAVALTVIVALIPGTFLGKWNFTLWVAFIAWAEYFALGGTVSTWKLILPSIPLGALSAAGWLATNTLLHQLLGSGGTFQSFLFLALANCIWVTGLVWVMSKSDIWTKGSLACFNGLTMWLAVYFTGSMPSVGPMANPYWAIAWAFIWTVAMCYFGWLLGVLNVALTFPHEVEQPVQKSTAQPR